MNGPLLGCFATARQAWAADWGADATAVFVCLVGYLVVAQKTTAGMSPRTALAVMRQRSSFVSPSYRLAPQHPVRHHENLDLRFPLPRLPAPVALFGVTKWLYFALAESGGGCRSPNNSPRSAPGARRNRRTHTNRAHNAAMPRPRKTIRSSQPMS